MKGVGAALGGQIHLPAGRTADIRRVGAALDLELHDRVDRRREAEAVAIQIHRFDAVIVEAVLRVARAVRRHSHRLSERTAQPSHGDATRVFRDSLPASTSASCTNDLPLSGSSTTFWLSITVPTVAFSVCNRIALADTFTLSAVCPMVIFTSMRAT